MWRDVGHSFNLKIKLEQKEQEGKRSHFFLVLTVGEKKKEERVPKLLSSIYRAQLVSSRWAIGQKFIASMTGTSGYLEQEISSRIQGRKFGKSKLSG